MGFLNKNVDKQSSVPYNEYIPASGGKMPVINKNVVRFDRTNNFQLKLTDEGYLRAKAKLTRVGIFDYIQPDGTVRKELRKPETVFDEKSIETLKLVPIVLGHPVRETGGFIDSKTARGLSRGAVGENITIEDIFLVANVLITDEDAIKAIQDEDCELSCGYTGDVVFEPGVWEGQHYDTWQDNIRYNHVAIVRKGRAGDEVKIYLDSADNLVSEIETGKQENKKLEDNKMPENVLLKKIILDGVEYEAEAKVIEKLAEAQKKLDELEKDFCSKDDFSKLEAERDTLKLKLDEMEKGVLSEDEIRKLANDRAALLATAMPILDSDDVKEKSNIEIMRAVVEKHNADIKLDGKDDVYIEARYDAVIEELEKSAANKARVQTHAIPDGKLDSVDTAKEKMEERMKNAWKDGGTE